VVGYVLGMLIFLSPSSPQTKILVFKKNLGIYSQTRVDVMERIGF